MLYYRKIHSLIKYKNKNWAFIKHILLCFQEKWLECENIFVHIAVITLVVIRPALTALMKLASHSWSWKSNPARICYGLCGITASSEQNDSRPNPFPSLLWCIHLLKMYVMGKHATEPVMQLQLLGDANKICIKWSVFMAFGRKLCRHFSTEQYDCVMKDSSFQLFNSEHQSWVKDNE